MVDVLIVGTGIAGMFTALNLPKEYKIKMITSSSVLECNSYLAQGGITIVLEDDLEGFIKDTLTAGQNENCLKTVKLVGKESKRNIDKLITYGADFETDKEGNYKFTKEAAHSKKRILYKGSETGKMIMETLVNEVSNRDNIEILEKRELIDIVVKDNKVYGGIVSCNGKEETILSKSLVLATGGIGGLFKRSTNDTSITGISLALAKKYNLKLKDIEYIQFHPTALSTNDTPKFLLSEALRGEGAILCTESGERFIDELLPRDVVAKAIIEKVENGEKIYLDARGLGAEYIKERFTGIYNGCLERGHDITKDLVPVEPVQHYFMGGLEVNPNGKTTMDGLYAVGETACTGLHGKNRLASNSLLEGLVFAKRVAKNLKVKEVSEVEIQDRSDWDYKEVARNVIIESRGDLEDELLNS